MITLRRIQLVVFLFLVGVVLLLVFNSGVDAGKRSQIDTFWGWYNCIDTEFEYPRCVFRFDDVWDAYTVGIVQHSVPEERKIIIKLIPMVAQE